MPKIFKKDIAPCCKYCSRGSVCKGTKKVVCAKKGIADFDDSCRSFKYDPLKREPFIKKDTGNFKKEGFVL